MGFPEPSRPLSQNCETTGKKYNMSDEPLESRAKTPITNASFLLPVVFHHFYFICHLAMCCVSVGGQKHDEMAERPGDEKLKHKTMFPTTIDELRKPGVPRFFLCSTPSIREGQALLPKHL